MPSKPGYAEGFSIHLLRSPTIAMTVLYGVVLAAFTVYFVAAWCVFRRVIKALKARPYHEVREARHNLQYQVGRHAIHQGASLNALIVLGLQRFESSCARSSGRPMLRPSFDHLFHHWVP